MTIIATTYDFDQAMARIKEVTGKRTQVELAALLGIRQSSVSDAKRRGSVPADWLLTLVSKTGTNPAWILTGKGPRYLVASMQAGEIVPGEYERPVEVVEPTTIEEHRRAILALLPAGFEVIILDPRIGAAIESGQAVVHDLSGDTPARAAA
jgi:hypothetical protein